MKYNFDQVVYRKDSDSLKWDIDGVKYPLWVADMDFEVAPAIQKAMERIINKNIYGYTILSSDFYKSIQRWWLKRHGIGLDTAMMQYVNGVMPAFKVIVERFSAPGENVILQTPVYHLFAQTIHDCGRNVSMNPLMYQDGEYFMDFIDLEKRMADPATTMMVICNPHNPTGTIWDKDSLSHVGKLAEKYGILVISDEIHCDIVEPGFSYIPYARVNETCRNHSITLVSTTKAFNIAGLQSGCTITPNSAIGNPLKVALQKSYMTHPNCFGAAASIAALEEGEEWLDEMNAYVSENKKVVEEFLKESLPQFKVIQSHATYLLWIDCRDYHEDSDTICDVLREKEGLFVSKGSQFGQGGKGFIRINVACPRQMLLEALLALRSALHSRSMRKRLEK